MNLETYLSLPMPVQPWLKRFFGTNDALTIFDIGACEGEESIRYSMMFPASTVYSFEPLKSNYQKALSNLKKYGKDDSHCYNLALGSENGEVDFFVSSGHPEHLAATSDWNYGNKSGSILPPSEIMAEHYQWLKFNEQQRVPLRRLDDFCQEKGIRHIHFVHMDVQGAELIVLDGAGDLLQQIDLVWMEVSRKEFYKGQPLEAGVLNYMKKNGFVFLFKNKEGSYSDHLYASSRFYREHGGQLDFLAKWRIFYMNNIKFWN